MSISKLSTSDTINNLPNGLVLVKTQTIGTTVSSVVVTGAFSTNYENYKIIINGGVGSTVGYLRLQLGASTASYYSASVDVTYTGTTANAASNNSTSFNYAGYFNGNYIAANFDLLSPFLSKFTTMQNSQSTSAAFFSTGGGYHGVATSYTDFTLIPGAGTLTGGTIYVYGYQKA